MKGADRFVVTGNPIRPSISVGKKSEGLRITHCKNEKPILLVTGGSQGSVALNDWVRKHLVSLLAQANIIHLTGKGKHGAGKKEGYFSMPFAMEELPHFYALATLAISRGGNGNISELAANGIPTILVPLRGLAQDHQEMNARAAEASGGCLVVEQADTEKELLPAVLRLLANTEERERMRMAIRSLYHPEAARKIAEVLLGKGRVREEEGTNGYSPI